MVEEAWKLAIERQDQQQALIHAPISAPSMCSLPGVPSPEIDLQTTEAVGLGFCLMLVYPIYVNNYTPNYSKLKLKIDTGPGLLAGGAHRTVISKMLIGPDTTPKPRRHSGGPHRCSQVIPDAPSPT